MTFSECIFIYKNTVVVILASFIFVLFMKQLAFDFRLLVSK